MSDKLQELIDFFTKLPGIGPRQAARLVMDMLNWNNKELGGFAEAINNIKSNILFCSECGNISDSELCGICRDPKRKQSKIAVVERVTDLISIEKTGAFDGVYHVLGGVINPAGGMLPEGLRIKGLLHRVQKLKERPDKVEVILATSHNTYGDTTAIYLQQELKPLKINITRLARGLSAGSTLEYTDGTTLADALKERR